LKLLNFKNVTGENDDDKDARTGRYLRFVISKCTVEPAPTRFYAPLGLFTEEDLQKLSAEYLGEIIVSPGGSFRYRVISGPLCRLYWERGRPQPNVNESAYCRNSNGKGWKRSHSNYLSYQLVGGNFVTVRWQAPGQKATDSTIISTRAAA